MIDNRYTASILNIFYGTMFSPITQPNNTFRKILRLSIFLGKDSFSISQPPISIDPFFIKSNRKMNATPSFGVSVDIRIAFLSSVDFHSNCCQN